MKVSILSIIFFITVATPIMAAMNCGTPSPGTSYCQSCGTRSSAEQSVRSTRARDDLAVLLDPRFQQNAIEASSFSGRRSWLHLKEL
ncbi:unnamed protein product [Tilletia controversa]|nr:unnamed protein product [Tilletia controversa]